MASSISFRKVRTQSASRLGRTQGGSAIRGSRLGTTVATALLTFALMIAGAHAAPQFLRVSWTNGIDTGTTAAVSWNSTAVGAGSDIEYGTTSALGNTATGTEVSTGGPVGYVHSVSLSGLEPATEYFYRVGGPGDWSAIETFRTAPSAETAGCEPVRFVAMGDGRSDDGYGPATHWKSILAEAVGHNPDAIILTGDQVHDGDDHQQWLHWLEESEGPTAWVPIMPSLGNHDDDQTVGDTAIYNKVFSVPTNSSSQTEDYYFFTIGNAIFVSLSSQTFGEGATPMADQAAWLDQVLTDNPRTWKFVYFHHPVYTGVLGLPNLLELNHPPNEKGQNEALVPIFDKHHVDIVFQGHNHHYQRYEPMCCGGGDDQGNPTGDFETGTVYVVTGGAGALTYDLGFLGIDIPGLLCSPLLSPGSVKCDGRHHYVMVDIDGLELSYKVYSTASQLLSNEAGNIELIDEFTISKAGTAPNCAPVTPDDGPEQAPDSAEEVTPDTAEVIADGGSSDTSTSDSGGTDTGATDAASEVVADNGPDASPSDTAGDVASPDTGADDTHSGSEVAPDVQPDNGKAPDTLVSKDTSGPGADVGGGPNSGDSSGCTGGHQNIPPLGLLVVGLLIALAMGRRRVW